MIPKEAKVCPHCRKKQGMSNFLILFISAIIILILYNTFVPSFDSYKEKAKNNISAPANTAAVKPMESTWEYGSSKDEMSGKITKYATKESINSVNFDFPYQGEQRGTIMVLSDGVLFYVKKGQVICHGGGEYGTCLVRVKFDDKKDTYVSARKSGDDSATIKFGNAFLKMLKNSKNLMIQPEVYHNGFPVFTFDLRGFVQK